jgi:hypothetical protein
MSGLARRVNEIPEAGVEFGYFYVRPLKKLQLSS